MNKLKYLTFVLSLIASFNLLQSNAVADEHRRSIYEDDDYDNYNYDKIPDELGDESEDQEEGEEKGKSLDSGDIDELEDESEESEKDESEDQEEGGEKGKSLDSGDIYD
jgi:hypothetical protein